MEGNRQVVAGGSGGHLKANFTLETKLEAFYTTGKIKLSADGKHLFSICDRHLKVTDVATGKNISTFSGEDDQILNFALSPDGTNLVTSLFSGIFQLWEWEENKLIKTWKGTHKGPVSCMIFDDSATLLVTGGTDGTIKVWDLIRQYITHNLTGSWGVFNVVAFHPVPERYVVFGAADDYKIRVWDLMTSTCTSVLNGHVSPVTCLTFSKNGEHMLSSGRDQIVIIWNIVDKVTAVKTIPIFEPIESVILVEPEEVLPKIGIDDLDGMKFITAGASGKLKVWSDTGKLLFTQKQGLTRPTNAEDGEPDGLLILQAFYHEALNRIVVVSFEQHVLFYKLKNFKLKKQLVGYNDDILDVTYLGQDETHFAVATNSSYIKVFEFSSLDCKLLQGHKSTVFCLDTFSKNPNLMASASKDHTIRIWCLNPVSKKISCVAVGDGHTYQVPTVLCSRMSTKFVISGSHDKCLKLWNVPDFSKTLKSEVVSLTINWTQLAHDSDINSVCVAPNDKLLASGSQDKTVKVWNVADVSLLAVLKGHRRGIWSVQFSPVDQVVASAAADGLIKIWSLSDFTCVKTFESEAVSMLKVLFVTKGSQLLTSTSDGLIKLWTIKLNECIKTLDGHSGKIWALKLNKSETKFLSGGDDSNIGLWRDVTEEEKAEERRKQDELVEQEQELQNLLFQKKFRKALLYCIRLEQPARALRVVKELLSLADGKDQLELALQDFNNDHIDVLLRFITTWNTNSKNCYEAQQVLNVILRKFTVEDLLKFPNISSVVQGLLPYTERHFQRYNRLLQQATFIEYTWQRMKLAEESRFS